MNERKVAGYSNSSGGDHIYVNDMTSHNNPKLLNINAQKGGFMIDRTDETIEETEEEHFYNSHTGSIDSVTQRVEELREKTEQIRNRANSKLS